MKNPKLKAAHKDNASSKKKLHELGHKSPSTKDTEAIPAMPKSHSPSLKDPEVRKHGFTANILNKVHFAASSTRGQKCGTMDPTAEDRHGDGEMTITYTYGYRYIRTDYTSVLVVSIVVIFFLAIILVELLDKVIET